MEEVVKYELNYESVALRRNKELAIAGGPVLFHDVEYMEVCETIVGVQKGWVEVGVVHDVKLSIPFWSDFNAGL